MFHFTQISHSTKKTIPGEWLGFSGQDARKSWFWNACDSVKQKRFSGSSFISARVTGALSTDVSETGETSCASNCNADGWKSKRMMLVWDAMTFFDFISILERAPVTFDRSQK
ncbi:hypothetical protein RND59_15925 [Vibrio ruber]|uniref:hypothetical protein n=1 Tax=Vibrio ruber TaxID=184755 RepID=UPI002892E7DE|nr:hypothetical protein [Vibrio ruber]WNJ97621.1 hypothetical protein RND59_15925 [Vibrio ruber]